MNKTLTRFSNGRDCIISKTSNIYPRLNYINNATQVNLANIPQLNHISRPFTTNKSCFTSNQDDSHRLNKSAETFHSLRRVKSNSQTNATHDTIESDKSSTFDKMNSITVDVKSFYGENERESLKSLTGLPMKGNYKTEIDPQRNYKKWKSNESHRNNDDENIYKREKEYLELILSRYGTPRKKVYNLLFEIEWKSLTTHYKILIINSILDFIRTENQYNEDLVLYRYAFRLFQRMFDTTHIPFLGWGRLVEKINPETGKVYIPPDFRKIHLELKRTNRFEPFLTLMSILLHSYRLISNPDTQINVNTFKSEIDDEEMLELRNREALLLDIFDKATSLWRSYLHDIIDPKANGQYIGAAYLELAARHRKLDILLDFMERHVKCSYNTDRYDTAFIELDNPFPYYSLIKLISLNDEYHHKLSKAFLALLKDFPKERELSKIGNIFISAICKGNKDHGLRILLNSLENLKNDFENGIEPKYIDGVPEVSKIDHIFYDIQNISTVIHSFRNDFHIHTFQKIIKIATILNLNDITELHNRYMELQLENGRYVAATKHFMETFTNEVNGNILKCKGKVFPNFSSFMRLLASISSPQMFRQWSKDGVTLEEMESEFESLLYYLTEKYPKKMKVASGLIFSRKVLNFSLQFYANLTEIPSAFEKVLHIFTSTFISSFDESTRNNTLIPNAYTYHVVFVACLTTKNLELQKEAHTLLDVILVDSKELFEDTRQFIQHAFRKSIREGNMVLLNRIINTYYLSPSTEGDPNVYTMTSEELDFMLSGLYKRELQLLEEEGESYNFESEYNPWDVFLVMKNYTDATPKTYEIILNWILVLKEHSKLQPTHIQTISEIESIIDIPILREGISSENAIAKDVITVTQSILHKLLEIHCDDNASHCIRLYQKYFTPPENNDYENQTLYLPPNTTTLSYLLRAYIAQRNMNAFHQTLEVFVDSSDNRELSYNLIVYCLQHLVDQGLYEAGLKVCREYFITPIQFFNLREKFVASKDILAITRVCVTNLKVPNPQLLERLLNAEAETP